MLAELWLGARYSVQVGGSPVFLAWRSVGTCYHTSCSDPFTPFPKVDVVVDILPFSPKERSKMSFKCQ